MTQPAGHPIQEIGPEEPLAESVAVIQAGFRTVAEALHLTQVNAPTHPSFMTIERLAEARARGTRLFALREGGRQIGFVALEAAQDGLFYVERLAVLPEHRRRGLGRMLMDFALAEVRQRGGRVISVAIIDEDAALKRWYQACGFAETGRKRFLHLPFTVCFMEKAVG